MRNAVSGIGAERGLPPVAGVGAAAETGAGEVEEADVAAYLFEILIGARRLATSRRQRFLAYLIGMAIEEARLLTMGRSAADGSRKLRS
ncbi:hypothetical protein [Parvibaculum sp.]|uniref:hypothetical protein n=1 Tax=Parvibaculum sp. TaxID=2024848 RepID=UPI00320EFEC5